MLHGACIDSRLISLQIPFQVLGDAPKYRFSCWVYLLWHFDLAKHSVACKVYVYLSPIRLNARWQSCNLWWQALQGLSELNPSFEQIDRFAGFTKTLGKLRKHYFVGTLATEICSKVKQKKDMSTKEMEEERSKKEN